jgi:hypothetical protein
MSNTYVIKNITKDLYVKQDFDNSPIELVPEGECTVFYEEGEAEVLLEELNDTKEDCYTLIEDTNSDNEDDDMISKADVIKSFRRVYPEKEVITTVCERLENIGFVQASFADGTFYFAVSENTVSPAYGSLNDVKKVYIGD